MKGILNTTELMSGKDGMLSVEAGGVMVDLAEIENFNTVMNVNVVEKQPAGDILVHRVPVSVSFDLTYTEMIIRDDLMLEPLLEEVAKGKIPTYRFQGKMEKPDGQEQRISYNSCVPNGTFSLQNLQPGEVITGERSFAINEVPKFIKSLASTYLK